MRTQQSCIRALDSKFKICSKKLTQQSWIKALDNKFSLQKAQKIYYKALTNFRICYKALKKTLLIFITLTCIAFQTGAAASVQAKAKLPQNLSGLNGPFDLAGALKTEVRYYVQETQFVHIGFDGKRTGSETYTVKMRCIPAALSGKGGDEYTIGKFSMRTGDGQAETIPDLAGWSYVFKVTASGKDDKSQVFGIPHSKFENLTTSRGSKLPAAACYIVYNTFIDFHGFNDVFGRPTAEGRGIQDLRTIGQKIVHDAAFTEAPVNLGSNIKEGSVFRNGEIKLLFKGISMVDGAACAVVGYDSGECTLRAIMPMSADKDIEMVGGSEYLGDLYIDLGTRWVRKVTLDEFVPGETRLPALGQEAAGQKIQIYTVRHLLTRMISKDEFEK
jgi:hypothetical protein